FGSFLTYLGYGYLDSWHGVATIFLLPCFVVGLWKTRALLSNENTFDWKSVWPLGNGPIISPPNAGRAGLMAAAIGLVGAGFTIQFLGMTSVFVATDLTFMGLNRADLNAINMRLIPLIAHDRAGFGGAVATCGVLLLGICWFSRPAKSLRQALLVAGVIGW